MPDRDITGEEIWRPIPGYQGVYEASSLGRIKSNDHFRPSPHGRPGIHAGRIFKKTRDRCGYHRVKLRGRRIYAHELVLLAFVGPRPPGLECCHNNGDPSDNRLSNLRWDTISSNRKDTMRHGRYKYYRSKRITVDDVARIRQLIHGGASVKQLSITYGVGRGTILNIRCGRTYKEVA